jgi:electron transport complex protein RnfC
LFSLFQKLTFRGGVHPSHDKKQTEALPIEPFPAPAKVVIPLSQHIGAPAKPVVKKGDLVKVGQVLGEPGGFVSAAVHSSVSGKVVAVGQYPHPLGKIVPAVEIDNDGTNESVAFCPLQGDWREVAPEEIVRVISDAGIVGMGGASFPTHVKLSPPKDKKIDTLIINGAECEPFLTADHRMLLEKTEQVLLGTLMIRKAVGARKVFIGIEDNKPDAITAVTQLLSDTRFSDISLAKLRTKYPQGGEKQLIYAIARRAVPSGGLPMDVGCVVQNVGTAYAVWDMVINGRPLFERVMTVTGPTVRKPRNLVVPIGTRLREVLDFCEIDYDTTKKVIMGGPMMGLAQSDLDAPVIKSTSGILGYNKLTEPVRAHECISCGNCVKACPVQLVPTTISRFVDRERYEDAGNWDILDCIECGSCTYVCPSKINLVHFMKLGKYHVTARRKAAAKK